MASTRLKNTKGIYKQDQEAIQKSSRYEMWKYKTIHQNSVFPAAGINMPMMTNGYNNGILSKNASDIESTLFGINSTNLVENKSPVVAQINHMNTVHFFDRPEQVIMPEPLVIENCQRPKGPFC
jgi:hypothetical protein